MLIMAFPLESEKIDSKKEYLKLNSILIGFWLLEQYINNPKISHNRIKMHFQYFWNGVNINIQRYFYSCLIIYMIPNEKACCTL